MKRSRSRQQAVAEDWWEGAEGLDDGGCLEAVEGHWPETGSV